MKRQGFYMFFFIPVFSACLESPTMTTGIVNGKEKPTVETEFINPIPNDGILFFQGTITDEGKSEIIETGFCWSTDSVNPGINGNVVTANTGDDKVFSYNLKGASGEKTYYWRAYAKNSYGYDFGKVDSCRTPQIWEEKEPLNTLGRGRAAVFILNDKIYITCGELESASGPINSNWEYSITNNRWFLLENFSGEARRYPVEFTIGNYAFVGTGQRAAGVAFNDFYRYDNTSDSWTSIDVPNDLVARFNAVAFSINGKGYVVGGSSATGENLNDVWQCDTENNSWQKKNDFPVKFYGGINICDSNRAFAGFGEASGTEKTLWEYNDETDSWSIFSTLPDEVVKKISSGVIIGNTIYIVDGSNTIWTCDMSDEIKTWKPKTVLPYELLNKFGEAGNQLLLTTGKSNSIFVGLGFTPLLYEYRPLWDN